VFPSQVEEALLRVEGTAPHYLIEVSRPGKLDEFTVHVEVQEEHFSDRMSEMQALKDDINRQIQNITGLRPNVELVAHRTLERTAGKATHVIDHRSKS
jgi:phenylacetate-CoA ligase